MPDPAELALQAVAWHEALADVPDADLEIVYRRAIQRHTGTFPLTTGAMRTAWDAVCEQRRWDGVVAAQQQRDADAQARQQARAAHQARMAADPVYRTEQEARAAAWYARWDARNAKAGLHLPPPDVSGEPLSDPTGDVAS